MPSEEKTENRDQKEKNRGTGIRKIRERNRVE
jgi:hypothetical protein